jgi:hypothetical protein
MADPESVLIPVEVRATDEAQRLATMLVCRYGEIGTPGGKREFFRNGAFTKSVGQRGDRIPFTDAHTDGTGKLKRPPIARPVSWDTSGAEELLATLRFFDTPEGWAAFCRARDGEFDGGSVGFQALDERTEDDTREVIEAALHHVMLVSSKNGGVPAYPGPRLLEVRAGDVEALLAVKWDPALADDHISAERLARLVLPDTSA